MLPSFEVLVFSVGCLATFIFPEESGAIPQNKEKKETCFFLRFYFYMYVCEPMWMWIVWAYVNAHVCEPMWMCVSLCGCVWAYVDVYVCEPMWMHMCVSLCGCIHCGSSFRLFGKWNRKISYTNTHTHKDFCTHLNVINTQQRQDLGKNSKGLITERWMEVTSRCRYKTKDSPSTGMIATPRHYKRDICGALSSRIQEDTTQGRLKLVVVNKNNKKIKIPVMNV